MGLLEPLFWQELFHFHGDFGENLEISCVLLKITLRIPHPRSLISVFVIRFQCWMQDFGKWVLGADLCLCCSHMA